MPSPATPLTPPLLEVRGVSKSFGSVPVLKEVSFSLQAGEVLAIMGENGAGKSTLMNILCGALQNDCGHIALDGKEVSFASPADARTAGIAMVHQELHLVPELTIAENIFLGSEPEIAAGFIDRDAMHIRASELLGRLSCMHPPHTKLSHLRVAEQQMVEIAKALARQARLIIFDEPTAALSETEVNNLFRIIRELKEKKAGIIYISHRLDEIFDIASGILVLRDGALVSEHAPAAENRKALIRDMVGQDIVEFFATHRQPAAETALSVRELTRRNESGAILLQDVSFDVRRGEILGIAGLLGSGRSELLEVLAGASGDTFSGKITLNGKAYHPRNSAQAIAAGVAYVTEDRKGNGLVLSQSIADNLILASLEKFSPRGVMQEGRIGKLARESMKRLDIAARGPTQEVATLSGGNQQKVVIGKWLVTHPSLLLLDEPTRGVDVGAKAALYSIFNELAGENLAQILVSSDWLELMALADRILVLQAGRPAALFDRGEYAQDLLLDYATPGGPVQPQFACLHKAAS
jgi:ABC-type sugar transport system ATPase subunit